MQILKFKPVIINNDVEYFIGHEAFKQVIDEANNNCHDYAVIVDKFIYEKFADFFEPLRNIIPIEVSENVKSFAGFQDLVSKLALMNLKKSDAIFCVGGGILGDLAGFVASVYLRGITFYQVPTTLLAMVDSAIGGKTGINTESGKNLIGCTKQPCKIFADLRFVESLPALQIKNGLAEMLKHGFISNIDLVSQLLKTGATEETITEACKIKIEIIKKDPLEIHERKFLNVGHTIAHAIEKDSNYKISHGEAVGIGMYMETKFAEKLGIISVVNAKMVYENIKALELPFTYVVKDLEKFMEYLKHDKKNEGEKIVFSFIKIPGKEIVIEGLSYDTVYEFLKN